MDHDLPLVPVLAGVLMAYAGHFAYTIIHRIWLAVTTNNSDPLPPVRFSPL
jgi:hypothetical protein